MKRYILPFLLGVMSTLPSYAATVSVAVLATDESQKSLGTVTFTDTPYGLLIVPNLATLPAGLHGFHLHEHANCADKGMAAGEHYDPKKTNTHLGPYADGHMGDLPVLYVGTDGFANIPTLAPRLKTDNLHGLALMVHAGGDNYSDTPPLGGGGAREACGTIE